MPSDSTPEQKLDPILLPVTVDDGIRFHEAWFSGENEHGKVEVSVPLHASCVMVSIQLADGRSGSYLLDVAEAVRWLMVREFALEADYAE